MFELIYGLSSLIFIISSLVSLYLSKSILWKISNTTLIISSFLCNSYKFKKYMFLDYFNIFIIALSYLKIFQIQMIYISFFLIELIYLKKINTTKDLTFISALIMCVKNTYNLNKFKFVWLLFHSLIGIYIYKIRIDHFENEKKFLFLNFVWHYCIMNILFISSFSI